MKLYKTIIITVLMTLSLYAQEPTDRVWDVYVSTMSVPLESGLDPCLYVYTVTTSENLIVQKNLKLGLMAELHSNLTYFEATAFTRSYGIYFDDQPDGKFKLGSCREEINKPDLSCSWTSKFGEINWKAGWYKYESRELTGELTFENGEWVYNGTWKWTSNNIDYGKIRFVFSADGTNFSGYYTRKNGTTEYSWHGSGDCN